MTKYVVGKSPLTFSILSLFPEVLEPYLSASIIGRAESQGVIETRVINPRDFTNDPHKKVDDSPYGGGSGMVLSCQPIDDAYQSLLPLKKSARVLLTAPTGRVFDHAMACELAEAGEIVLLCGHYEGFDERIKDVINTHNAERGASLIEEVSIGDYVLTGGELAALTIVDAVTRQCPGAVQKFSSVESDSFYNGLLDHPHYTRPAEYKGHTVPDVLLSGDHAAIEAWRKQQSLERTQLYRPDLMT